MALRRFRKTSAGIADLHSACTTSAEQKPSATRRSQSDLYECTWGYLFQISPYWRSSRS